MGAMGGASLGIFARDHIAYDILILLDTHNLSVRQKLSFLDLPKMANGKANWQIWQICIFCQKEGSIRLSTVIVHSPNLHRLALLSSHTTVELLSSRSGILSGSWEGADLRGSWRRSWSWELMEEMKGR